MSARTYVPNGSGDQVGSLFMVFQPLENKNTTKLCSFPSHPESADQHPDGLTGAAEEVTCRGKNAIPGCLPVPQPLPRLACPIVCLTSC